MVAVRRGGAERGDAEGRGVRFELARAVASGVLMGLARLCERTVRSSDPEYPSAARVIALPALQYAAIVLREKSERVWSAPLDEDAEDIKQAAGLGIFDRRN
jgi:hypothetical protein